MHGKNRNICDLSSCVVQKFNGYDILKSELKNEEKQFHEPIDIFYEPVNDESSVKCFLTDHLHLAYRSYGLKLGIDNDKNENRITMQWYYCGKYIVRYGNFKKHIKNCSDIDGVGYKFENNIIINSQDNFKYMGDLPFTIYSHFETAAGKKKQKIKSASLFTTYST